MEYRETYVPRRRPVIRIRPRLDIPDEEFDDIIFRLLPSMMKLTAWNFFWFLVIIFTVKQWWPQSIPLSMKQFLPIKGTFLQWCRSSWVLLAWGVSVTTIVKLTSSNTFSYNRRAEQHLGQGLLISLWAGVTEELDHRWLRFYVSMLMVQIGSIFTFGLVEWVYTHMGIPLADWATFYQLHAQLNQPQAWFIGAALISSNGEFRDGHSYQGTFGKVNAWFIGMFMFWLVFRYGLVAAMTIHTLYDVGIFSVRYLDAVIERSKGNPPSPAPHY